ncbi:hypothetical protein CORC01_14357 [Colletotrichum orchidophilum]|uniref:Uncharacterized protein n=1 Tax=Colletotrichum orchidophilum TaxID=1209926 RepID=A0A1G4AME9_9PEZI|nr:uncharacterized protein CORC01_14357 [Colletotrichum orchidophilum]OHE90344.1 hypothetical protein CORC01_14357 [Colletotrichum orchidophilum]
MARHIDNLATFLDQFAHGLSDDNLSKRLTRTAILLRNPPYHTTAAQPTRSRHKSAQKCLFTIRWELGDPTYYLCLFASSITALSTERRELSEVLAKWPGKDDISSAFTGRAQAIVEKHLAEEGSEESPAHTSFQKRRQSMTHPSPQQSVNDPGSRHKRARLDGDYKGLMSVGRIVTQSQQGEDQSNIPQFREEYLDNAFDESHQLPLDARTEDSWRHQNVLIQERSASTLLVAEKYQPSQGPKVGGAAGIGREVDISHQASGDTGIRSQYGKAERSRSGESDDGEVSDESNDSDNEGRVPLLAPDRSAQTARTQEGMTLQKTL